MVWVAHWTFCIIYIYRLACLLLLLEHLPILANQALSSSFSSLAFSCFCPMPKRCSSRVHGLLCGAFIFVASFAFFPAIMLRSFLWLYSFLQNSCVLTTGMIYGSF